MTKNFQQFVASHKRDERKMPFGPVVIGPLLYPFFKDVQIGRASCRERV